MTSTAAVGTPFDSPVEVLHRFYAGLDARRYADMASQLHPDAVWLRQGRELRGPAAVLAALEKRPTNTNTVHVITNGHCDFVSDTRVVVSAYQTVYKSSVQGGAAAAAPCGPTKISVVTAELVRESAGPWRISRLSSQAAMDFGR